MFIGKLGIVLLRLQVNIFKFWALTSHPEFSVWGCRSSLHIKWDTINSVKHTLTGIVNAEFTYWICCQNVSFRCIALKVIWMGLTSVTKEASSMEKMLFIAVLAFSSLDFVCLWQGLTWYFLRSLLIRNWHLRAHCTVKSKLESILLYKWLGMKSVPGILGYLVGFSRRHIILGLLQAYKNHTWKISKFKRILELTSLCYNLVAQALGVCCLLLCQYIEKIWEKTLTQLF